MMATCCLGKDSSIQAGMQEGSPPRQYELGGAPHVRFTKADISQLWTEEETSPLFSRKELNDSNRCEQ